MSENWSEKELHASVDAYIEMRRFELKGKPFVKKDYYAQLAADFGRTAKAYEYRMQNISYVYSLQGRQWVSGLKPARNVGGQVLKILERLIAKSEGQQFGETAQFNASVEKSRKNKATFQPDGTKNPGQKLSTVTHYSRNAAVVAWVLRKAGGICECCGEAAPFIREDGTPFLEVHHVHQLADGGEDTIENAVAICPNCHRELHYGIDRRTATKRLQTEIERLKAPPEMHA